MCVILASEGECTRQRLKTRLSNHDEERIDPESFYAAVTALVDAGFVTERADGLADVYSLTDDGERRVYEHFEWLCEELPDEPQ